MALTLTVLDRSKGNAEAMEERLDDLRIEIVRLQEHQKAKDAAMLVAATGVQDAVNEIANVRERIAALQASCVQRQ